MPVNSLRLWRVTFLRSKTFGVSVDFVKVIFEPLCKHLTVCAVFVVVGFFGHFWRAEKGRILDGLDKNINCTVYTNFQHTKLYCFQLKSQPRISFCKS